MTGQTLQSTQTLFHRIWFGTRTDRGGDGPVPRIGGGGFTEVAPGAEFLFMAIFWISTVSFLILMVLMVYFVWKYRRRPGAAIQRSPAHNTPLELAWTIVPLLVLVWIFFEGFWVYIDGMMGGSAPEEIRVTGSKWQWQAVYPNGGISQEDTKIGSKLDAPVFVVPAGRPVLIRLSSADVLHSFWVPDFRWKRDVFPNRFSSFTFTTTPLNENDPILDEATGRRYRDHYIFCAEYCGDQHSDMSAIMRVVEPEDYVAIVTGWSGPGPGATPEQRGEFAARKHGCLSCHSTDGRPLVGPTWKNMFGDTRNFTDGSSAVADENYIRESIYLPNAKIVAGYGPQMSTFQGRVSEEELEHLIALMKSLSDAAPASLLDQPGAPPASPAERLQGDEPPDGDGER